MNTTIWYIDDDGKPAQAEIESLTIGDTEIPIVNGRLQLPETPFTRAVATAEWELIRKYDRGDYRT